MEMEEVKSKKLKPVTFVSGKYGYNRQNTAQQLLLLKALSVTQDPQKLKTLIGARTVSEVMRTFDKLAIRKEYHKALARKGISFDYLIQGLKNEIDKDDNKACDKIKAIQTILRSVGVDKYEDTAISGGNWEDAILKANEESSKTDSAIQSNGDNLSLPSASEIVEYEVKIPEPPEGVKELRQRERDIGKSLYE